MIEGTGIAQSPLEFAEAAASIVTDYASFSYIAIRPSWLTEGKAAWIQFR